MNFIREYATRLRWRAVVAHGGARALPCARVALATCVLLFPIASLDAADISLSRSSVYDGLQPIVVDAAWFGGAADGAVRVAVKGAGNETAYLQPAAGEKEVVWNPTAAGTYTLTLERQVGEAWEPTDYSRQLTVNGITTATAEDIELNLSAPGEAVAEDTFVDIAVGTRTNAVMHPIVYSTEWTKGSDAVKIYQDGQLVYEGTGEGTTEWTPPGNGSYELLMRTFAGESPTGSDLKAAFFVTGQAAVTQVTARQRYPWNGMVDIAFTITGDAETAYQVSFTAKDMAGGTNLTMKTVEVVGAAARSVIAPYQLGPGNYRAVWNAGADLPDGTELERVAITVEAK